MSSSSFYSGSGDDGFTGLLGEGRVPKYDARPNAYGTLDEASAALGLARSLAQSPDLVEVVVSIQRDLYHMMAEVAALPDQAEKFRRVDQVRIEWLEEQVAYYEEQVEMPKEFVIPGDSTAGAAFDLARTVVRRAERLVARLIHEDHLENNKLLVYLNRLSSLCFVLALHANQQDGVAKPSLAKGESN